MYSEIKFIFSLLDKTSKIKIIAFGFLRILTGLLDLFGVLLIGLILAELAGNISGDNKNQSLNIFGLTSIVQNFSILNLTIAAACLFLVKSVLAVYFSKITFSTLARAESHVAVDAYRLILRNISMTSSRYSKSDLNYLMTQSSGAIIEILSGLILIISELFLSISILITFSFVNFKITVFIIIYFFAVAIVLNFFIGTKLKKYAEISTAASLATATTLFDTLGAYREIIAFKKENFFLSKFSGSKFEYSFSGSQGAYLNGIPRFVTESALMIGTLILIAISFQAGNLSQSAQTIGIFITGGMKITSSLLPIQNTLISFKTLRIRAQMLIDFFKFIPTKTFQNRFEVQEYNAKSPSKNINGPIGVRLSDATYRYPDQAQIVLKGLNIAIEPGQFVALIGPSGSGKSTLADVIVNLIQLESGDIVYFDSEQNEIPFKDLNIGYVPQNPGIVFGTIRENIAFGIDEKCVDMVKIQQALKNSHLLETVTGLPDGINTDLGKQSDSLSGGQLQRIGLARALYSEPKLLVLDEATSALDAETESTVTEFLNQLRGECTTLVIAHRLSTVQNADVVYVLDQGEIVASGKFSDLAKSNEMVAKYIELSEIK